MTSQASAQTNTPSRTGADGSLHLRSLDSRVTTECFLSFSTAVLSVAVAVKSSCLQHRATSYVLDLRSFFYGCLLLFTFSMTQVYLPKLISRLTSQINPTSTITPTESPLAWIPNPHVAPLKANEQDSEASSNQSNSPSKLSSLALRIYCLQSLVILACIGFGPTLLIARAPEPYRSVLVLLLIGQSCSAISVLAELRFLFFRRSSSIPGAELDAEPNSFVAFHLQRFKFFFSDFITFTSTLLSISLASLILVPPEWLAEAVFDDARNKKRQRRPGLKWFKGVCMVLSPVSGVYAVLRILGILLVP